VEFVSEWSATGGVWCGWSYRGELAAARSGPWSARARANAAAAATRRRRRQRTKQAANLPPWAACRIGSGWWRPGPWLQSAAACRRSSCLVTRGMGRARRRQRSTGGARAERARCATDSRRRGGTVPRVCAVHKQQQQGVRNHEISLWPLALPACLPF
jgi:hypothetical protein